VLKAKEEKKMVREQGITAEPAPIMNLFPFNGAWKHAVMAECCGYLLD